MCQSFTDRRKKAIKERARRFASVIGYLHVPQKYSAFVPFNSQWLSASIHKSKISFECDVAFVVITLALFRLFNYTQSNSILRLQIAVEEESCLESDKTCVIRLWHNIQRTTK